jgi:hypothetical protein
MPFIKPRRRLLLPSRRSLIAGAAATLAMPYVARAQSPMLPGFPPGVFNSHAALDAGGSAPWTPLSLPSLLFWYKGDVGVTGTTSVTAWADQSGSGSKNLSSVGSGGDPSTTTVHGLQAVLFNDQTAMQSGTSAVSLGGSVCSVFGVLEMVSGTTGNPTPWIYLPTGATSSVYDGTFFLESNGSLFIGFHYNPTSTVASETIGSMSYGTFYQAGHTFDGTNQNLFVGDSALGSNTPTYTTGDGTSFASTGLIGLGGFKLGGVGEIGLKGTICEVVGTSNVISGTNLALLSTYFTTRWGV